MCAHITVNIQSLCATQHWWQAVKCFPTSVLTFQLITLCLLGAMIGLKQLLRARRSPGAQPVLYSSRRLNLPCPLHMPLVPCSIQSDGARAQLEVTLTKASPFPSQEQCECSTPAFPPVNHSRPTELFICGNHYLAMAQQILCLYIWACDAHAWHFSSTTRYAPGGMPTPSLCINAVGRSLARTWHGTGNLQLSCAKAPIKPHLGVGQLVAGDEGKQSDGFPRTCRHLKWRVG